MNEPGEFVCAMVAPSSLSIPTGSQQIYLSDSQPDRVNLLTQALPNGLSILDKVAASCEHGLSQNLR